MGRDVEHMDTTAPLPRSLGIAAKPWSRGAADNDVHPEDQTSA
jgi:hypothetical protein